MGCINTPERTSYYCKEHIKIKQKYAFKFMDGTVYLNLEDISIKKGKIKDKNLKIHDAYIDQYDNLLFLVNYGENDVVSHFWITSKQITASKIENYSEQLKNILNITSIDDLKCNSTKIFTLPCNKKTRTVGIWLACYTCGIIASYKVYN